MKYYYLLSGLPNLEHDEGKPVPDPEWLHEEFEQQLTEADMKLVELVSRDVHDMPLSEEQQEHAATLKEPELTNYLLTLYYHEGMECGNEFVRNWFEYRQLVNNILVALTCRKHGWDVKPQVIGDSEAAQMLRSSNARDFGLSPVVDDYNAIAAIAEEEDLYVREHKIDALLWQWLEQQSFNHFFGVEQVIAYWLQVRLLNRWKALTVEQGTEVFRNLLKELKKDTENL